MRFVITGGPGTGKTATINEIASLGYQIVPEASRQIILDEKAKTNPVLPNTNLPEFQKLVLRRQLVLEGSSIPQLPAFFDRGVIDTMAYYTVNELPVPEEIREAVRSHPRYSAVFLLEPLPNYEKDEARFEDFEFGMRIHHTIRKSYLEAGYEIQHVPVLSAKDRAQHILDKTVLSQQ